jgi:hypothetical protein
VIRPHIRGLPAGAKGILPTIWGAFITTVVLALAFSFANVWNLDRTLGVEPHVAPLIGPAVDITAFGLLVVVPWLVLAGASTERLRPANRLMAAAGFLTLALNSAPSAIDGWIHHDARAWGRAAVEAIVPLLLIAWSHVGPKLIALFVEVRARHAEELAEALRIEWEGSAEAAAQRSADVQATVAEALRAASVEHSTELAETAARHAAELTAESAKRAEMESTLASMEAEHQVAVESSTRRIAQAEAERDRLRGAAKDGRTSTPRKPRTDPGQGSAEPSRPTPRKSAAELLEERVDAAKEALPTWQLETPAGPEIRSALGLKSDGVVSAIRQRLEADRLGLTNDDSKERSA